MRPKAVYQTHTAPAERRLVRGLCVGFGDTVVLDCLLSEAWPPPTGALYIHPICGF